MINRILINTISYSKGMGKPQIWSNKIVTDYGYAKTI